MKTFRIPPILPFLPGSSPSSFRAVVAATTVVLWLGSSCLGFWFLLDHDTAVLNQSTSGSSVDTMVSETVAPRSKTSLHGLIPIEGELSVIVALHPKCPCTLTTLAELSRLLRKAEQPIRCTVLVAVPVESTDDWADTPTVNEAKLLPNTELVLDFNANRAGELGLSVSGQILVVSDDGAVLFSGGITSGRTCTTTNIGSETVASLFDGKTTRSLSPPTFGCKLI